MPTFSRATVGMETWQLTFPFAASAAAATKQYGKILRNPTGVTVDTSATPFNIPVNQAIRIVDWYVAKSGDNNASAQIDIDINGVAERVGLTTDAILITNLTRPRMIQLTARPGDSVAPFNTNLAAIGTSAVTNTEYAIVLVQPVAGRVPGARG